MLSKKIVNFNDLENLSIKVKIGRKNFNAILLQKNNYLYMRIDMLKDIELWRDLDNRFEILCGEFVYKNEKVTFIGCEFIGQSSTGINPIKEATVDYRIDRILLGKKITKAEYKSISKYEVVYNNIDCFTNDKPYSMNEKLEYKGIATNYDFLLKDRKISLCFSCNCELGDNSFTIDRSTSVMFDHDKKKLNVAKVISNIYIFRNFLMLLLKKAIIVEKQFVFIGDEKCQLIDCRDDILPSVGKDLEEHLNHRCLKIKNISNLSEIFEAFLNDYERLEPLIELYYNVTQFKVPNLTRFVNSITMLEYCSRTFDYVSALNLTKQKKTNQPKSKVNDAEYKDMVISLIGNVNEVYNFSQNEIEQIADNIKNARVFYIHCKNKKSVKKLSYDEQFSYSYFIQDVIILNIYKNIGLDLQNFEYISFLDFYYEKKELL